MNYYLVDFENVKTDGIKDFNGICKGDTFLVFYSESCKNITIDVLESVLELKLQFKSFKTTTGTKNALDFQLSSYLGYLISNSMENDRFYIVSNDKGYDCLCAFWKQLGFQIERISLQKTEENTAKKTAAKTTSKKKESKVAASDLATLADIEKYVNNEDKPGEILPIFNQYKTRTSINNGLVKLYGDTKKAGAVYKKLKPLLTEKKKS